MKSPFRRRKRPSGKIVQQGEAKAKKAEQQAKLEAKMAVPEWAQEATGTEETKNGSFMQSLRGDGEAGAGFGAGIFEDLHAAFSGAKKIQLQEQEAEKLRRHDDLQQAGTGGNRPDLDSGRIRIRTTRPKDQGEDS
ncbi:DUF6191 domain-containing protein [Actinocorallia longicatena]|uniref:Uncharacterized protein n=1 Tax=Actinocorallia longicatena TaxID=111803 RepID=A0ABP6QCT5_9ACTN